MKYLMKAYWWKLLTVILLIYTVIGGFLMPAPRLPILNETIRILHFHVPMWFGMIIMFLVSVFYAIKYLSTIEMFLIRLIHLKSIKNNTNISNNNQNLV